MNELKELSDGRTVQSKPEGWEWDHRPVTRPSHIEEFQQDPGWEEGPNIFERQDGTKKGFLVAIIDEIILKESEDYTLLTKANDWSMINIEQHRCVAFRTFLESKHSMENKTFDGFSSIAGITKSKAASRLVNRTVNGNSVEIYVNSRTSYNDSSFEDEVELLIKVNDDSLKISCELKEPSPSEGKYYPIFQKTTTTIKGENYGSSSDFFKKLSELNIVTVRTFDTEKYNLYFALPL